MFLNIPENIVICINEDKTNYTIFPIKDKECYNIDCTNDWKSKQNKIINENNYNNKIDIYIKITKLLENVADSGTYIAYETNITDISNIETNIEAIKLYFENERSSIKSECSLKKYDIYPL